jgi:replicative DNA helicase
MRETLPPYNLDAEESVLGSILIDPDCISVLKVYTEDFFSEQNQFVFGAMKNLDARKIPANEITVAQELANLGKLDEAGGASYLSHLVAHCPTSLHAEYYAKIVRDCATNRRWISAAGQIENIGYKNLEPKESDEQIQKIIRGISTSIEDDSLITPKEWADKGADRYATLSRGARNSILTGIKQLDYETGGLFPGEMWVLGGFTGEGKTTLKMQIAEYMQLYGNVLDVSLEMNWRGLLDRSMASKLMVHPRSIRAGNYSDEFYEQIVNILPTIAETNIYLLGKGLTVGASISVDTLYNVAYKMKQRHGLVAIVVDYLQLLFDKGKTPYERVSNTSTQMKQILEALEVPGLVLSQFHRVDKNQKETRPTMSDNRDSGLIETNADGVLLMYRPEKYPKLIAEHPELRGTAELILAKNRYGDCDINIPLIWNNERRIYE